tara:strand:+ start:93 stop:242 length:150 start_codon:yes stop_codon:yes gene_type:complete
MSWIILAIVAASFWAAHTMLAHYFDGHVNQLTEYIKSFKRVKSEHKTLD